MSKRNSIIVVLSVLVLIVGSLLFFYFRPQNSSTQTQNPITGQVGNIFGNNGGNKTPSTSTAGINGSGNTGGKNTAKLVEIYRTPISGSVLFTNTANQDVLRFVDRGNGNVYEYIPSSQTGVPTRLTNTTIPKIQEAIWSDLGNSVIFRYLDNDTDNIVSFSGTIATTSATTTSPAAITGSFLQSNIAELVTNPTGDKIFALSENSDGSGSTGITATLLGGSKKEIFTSPVSLWNIAWPTTNTITFTTKPTYKDYGYAYFFNMQSGSLDKILGNILGLSTLTNNDGSLMAYSASTGNSFNLDVYDVTNKVDENLQIATLADKCIWGQKDNTVLYCAIPQNIPSDNYPDAWYQGTESFSDNIWSINTQTGVTTEIYQIGSNENANIDAIDLHISSDDQYLAFTNKTDLTLWVLNLNK